MKKGATKPNTKNTQQVEFLKEKIQKAKSAIIVDYQGLTVKEQTQLRQAIAEVGGEFVVSKNTLMRIAFDNKALDTTLKGMNALLLAMKDAVSPLKAVVKFHEETDKLTIKMGIMDGKILEESDVEALSKLPSKEELITTLISRIQGPAYGLVNALSDNQRKLVYVLKNIQDNK